MKVIWSELIFKFKDEGEAFKWEWLFVDLLHMRYICHNGFYNAFQWV